jgi:hypothetical protein
MIREPERHFEQLTINPRFRELHLRVLSVGRVDDAGAADLSDFLPISIKHPARDFTRPNHVLNEENPSREAKTQLVKQLDVLQQIVVGGCGVRVFVVVAIYQQFHDGFGAVGDEVVLLRRRRYQWNLADWVDLLSFRLQRSFTRLGQLFEAVVLGLSQKLRRSPNRFWQCH